MDRITGLPHTAPARPGRTAPAAAPFRPAWAAEVATPAQVATVAPPPQDRRAPDRRALSRARAILADLALLQSGLLAGYADPAVLRRLADSAPTAAGHPGLADLLDHASLRAQVELARREAPR